MEISLPEKLDVKWVAIYDAILKRKTNTVVERLKTYTIILLAFLPFVIVSLYLWLNYKMQAPLLYTFAIIGISIWFIMLDIQNKTNYDEKSIFTTIQWLASRTPTQQATLLKCYLRRHPHEEEYLIQNLGYGTNHIHLFY